MSDQTKQCPKCNSTMEDGFRLDVGSPFDNKVTREQWVKAGDTGLEEKMTKKLWSDKIFKQSMPVNTYRCTKCGFLESYAFPIQS